MNIDALEVERSHHLFTGTNLMQTSPGFGICLNVVVEQDVMIIPSILYHFLGMNQS
jgi:hypothetical protein